MMQRTSARQVSIAVSRDALIAPVALSVSLHRLPLITLLLHTLR